MLSGQVSEEYAQAVFQMAEERSLASEVQEQLSAVVQACHDSAELFTVFYHPRIPTHVKKEAVRSLFSPVLADFAAKFLLLLIDKRRENLLPDIVKAYGRLLDKSRNICEVEVVTTEPLDKAQQNAFTAKLNGLTGKNIQLINRVDKKILGGAVLRIGDKRIDGSIASQIEQLRSILLKKEVTRIGVTS